MKPTEIKYTKRFNVGPYEHEEFTVHATLDDSGEDDVVEGFSALKNAVKTAKETGEAIANPTTQPDKNKNGKDEKNAKTAKNGKKPKEEVEEPAEEETANPPEEETETETVGEEEEAETPPAKTEKTGKGFKKKGSPYSRANETHKNIMAQQLKKINPNWNKTEDGKKKGKKLSQTLNGTDFLDANGEVVPSFVAALKKGLK